MKTELLILKEKLDDILNDESINSESVLFCSQELDKIILEYYQKWCSIREVTIDGRQ
jgi:hypothetical protein